MKRFLVWLPEKTFTFHLTKLGYEKDTNIKVAQLQSQSSHRSNSWWPLTSFSKTSFVTKLIGTETAIAFLRRFFPTAKAMEKIENVSLNPMPTSNYLQPLRMEFTQNGKKKYWDFVRSHQAVAVVLFNTSRNVLLLVKQFRPAVYFGNLPQEVKNRKGGNEMAPVYESVLNIDVLKYPASSGITLECCAGIIDKPGLNPAEIAREEVFEECGYSVPIDKFEYITTCVSNIGVNGEKLMMYYAEVTDGMNTGKGGGNEEEGEMIEVVELTIPEVRKYISADHVNSSGSFLFSMTWFLMNKAPAAQN